MDRCPVCDFPETDGLYDIIVRSADPSLVVTLACDFAERVVDLTAYPAENREWLAAARDWRTYPKANVATVGEAQAGDAQAQAGDAQAQAARAVACAVQTSIQARATGETNSMPEYAGMVIQAGFTATAAAHATDNPKAEIAWQLKRTRELACTCSVLEAGPIDSRSRNSLLAC